MAPDCFACRTEECARCSRCGRGFCWRHGRGQTPHGRPSWLCDLCWYDRASFRAILPGIIGGVLLINALFALLL